MVSLVFGQRVLLFTICLQIVDLLTKFLQSSVSLPPKNNLGQLRMQIYRVMETYLRGDSRTNELYFAKYIPWFSTQFDKPVSEKESKTGSIFICV